MCCFRSRTTNLELSQVFHFLAYRGTPSLPLTNMDGRFFGFHRLDCQHQLDPTAFKGYIHSFWNIPMTRRHWTQNCIAHFHNILVVVMSLMSLFRILTVRCESILHSQNLNYQVLMEGSLHILTHHLFTQRSLQSTAFQSPKKPGFQDDLAKLLHTRPPKVTAPADSVKGCWNFRFVQVEGSSWQEIQLESI